MSTSISQVHPTLTLVFLISGVRVQDPALILVSWSKTHMCNHYGFVLRMGHKVVGPVRCVIYVKEPSYTYYKGKELASVFLAYSSP